MIWQLFAVALVGLYALNRLTRWMHRRGWIQWKMRRGSSSALGDAMLGVQLIYQPQVREVLEQRLEEPSEAGESGDPPEAGDATGQTSTSDRIVRRT